MSPWSFLDFKVPNIFSFPALILRLNLGLSFPFIPLVSFYQPSEGLSENFQIVTRKFMDLSYLKNYWIKFLINLGKRLL